MTNGAVSIETPEGVRFSLPLAGIVTRFLAWLIDVLAVSVGAGFLSKILLVFAPLSPDTAQALIVVAYFAISVGYSMAFEWFWHGQTPGKRLLSLRVMDANGLKLQPAQIVLRNLLRSLDSLPGTYLVGGVSALLSVKGQRLGDMVANTIVVRQRRAKPPDLERLTLEDKFNSLLSLPHLAARLRQRIPPELADLAYQALLRRNELAPEVKLEVFRLLAGRFRELVKYPDELTAALTDERYVRNSLRIALTAGGLRATKTATANL